MQKESLKRGFAKRVMVESPVQRAAMTVHGRFSSGLLGRGEGSSERFCHFNPARRESSPPVEGVVCPSPIRASLQWPPSKEGIEMMINHTLCFANLLSGASNCVLFALVQLRQLVLPVGATSSMWLHVFCESDFFSTPPSGTGGFSCLRGGKYTIGR